PRPAPLVPPREREVGGVRGALPGGAGGQPRGRGALPFLVPEGAGGAALRGEGSGTQSGRGAGRPPQGGAGGRGERRQAMSAEEEGGRYASPPCMAGEVAPDYFDPLAVDPQQARDVARWRRGERERLRAERLAMSVEARATVGRALAGHLRALLDARFGEARGKVFSGYWPIKGEFDLRPLMAELHGAGIIVALPVVEVKAAPLVFRRWTPETRMVRGDWNIPV